MGFLDFPDTQFFIILTGNIIHPLGKIALSETTDLGNIQCQFQKVGTHDGSERLRLEIFGNDFYDTPIYVSNWVSYSDIESLGSTHWAGNIAFDFNHNVLNKELTYHVGIRADNYSYEDDVKYLGVALDWPEDINTDAVSTERGAAMAIFGYK